MLLQPLITKYLRRNNRRLMSFASAPNSTVLPPPRENQTYLLYLHVPFCEVLCPFCPFHRVEFENTRARNYYRALRTEIKRVTDLGYRFNEVYVGGGTPTVIPEELAETLNLVRAQHSIGQISVETNPDHLADPRLERLVDTGVTRLSVGVQSFDDRLLKQMGRYEKFGSGDVIQAHLSQVQGTFNTLNVDMIFNFPDQTESSLQRDLDILTKKLGVDQVSFYPLMTAHSTRRTMSVKLGKVDYRREPVLYRQIANHMLDAGYTRSSAWCFSRQPGLLDEYIVDEEEYLGLGSGSFSYLNGALYATTFSINHYLRLINGGGTGIVRRRAMSTRDQMRYYLLTRLFGGSLDLNAAERRFQGKFEKTLWLELTALKLSRAVAGTDSGLELRGWGYYLWVMMMREFFIGVNNFRDEMRHHIALETAALAARP
jgi:coproporphyrinogen III oxidase-like Fe-S oxidoreductase